MKTTSCGILVANADGELLLCHASGTSRWDIPKGVSDAGESAPQTAIRETAEECGLVFQAEDLLDLGCHAYRSGKDLHLFAVLIERIDTRACICTTQFRDRWGRMRPEMDGFEWTAIANVPERCARSMATLLTRTISLPLVLQRLLSMGRVATARRGPPP
jgi:putative (di)nucleoside polyphosphate hydrolase